MKPWLVGEMNPYGDKPEMALYPLPENASGARLARALGMSRTQYLRAFERRNLLTLLPGKPNWSEPRARAAAKVILDSSCAAPLVLLGARVARAFGVKFKPWFQGWTAVSDGTLRRVTMLPHPSGLNRIWNDPRSSGWAKALVLPLLEAA